LYLNYLQISALQFVILSTLTISAALPLISQSDKPREFDYNPIGEPLIFGNEDNLSSLNCGELEANDTARGKHFSWDAVVQIGDRKCAGIFISRKTVLTSKAVLRFTPRNITFCFYNKVRPALNRSIMRK
jgi:hypothetical protein